MKGNRLLLFLSGRRKKRLVESNEDVVFVSSTPHPLSLTPAYGGREMIGILFPSSVTGGGIKGGGKAQKAQDDNCSGM
jgi:hypothetical protein